MVFGFGSRKAKGQSGNQRPQVRSSPSLPELNQQGIRWPENLVDGQELGNNYRANHEKHGALRTSLSLNDRSFVPFHRPFRSPSLRNEKSPETSIAARFMSLTNSPPSAWARSPTGVPSRQRSSRKQHAPPTFNLMVAGGQGTGKTSLLRLLLETADLSPGATAEQKSALENFVQSSGTRTRDISSTFAEILESRYDRLLLSVIDTPGLDFAEGRELKLDRQVSSIIKYLEVQFADTLEEESKVMRNRKGDQHVHLCIYLIDPASVMTPSARRAKTTVPALRGRTASMSSVSKPELKRTKTDTTAGQDDPTEELAMSPADLRIVKRLSQRVNVLPVIGLADTLTDSRLEAIKAAVRRDLELHEIGFGVFGPDLAPSSAIDSPGSPIPEDDDAAAERTTRPVIKLRKSSTRRSRSRARDDEDNVNPDGHFPERDSVASVRFSAQALATLNMSDLLPFGIISPEESLVTRIAIHPLPNGRDEQNGHAIEDAGEKSLISPKLPRVPEDAPKNLRGQFIRRFRWGAVDVLNPEHCDFAALRTAVLSTHLKALRATTRDVLYEKYRTERLLLRRATRNISDHEKQRIMEDLNI